MLCLFIIINTTYYTKAAFFPPPITLDVDKLLLRDMTLYLPDIPILDNDIDIDFNFFSFDFGIKYYWYTC